MKKTTKSILFLLVLVIVLVFPTISFSITTTVTNEIELQNALNDPNTDIIIVANDIEVSNRITLPDENRTINIQSSQLATIRANGTDYIFQYNTGGNNLNINFSNVIVDGNYNASFLYMNGQNGYLTINQLQCRNTRAIARPEGGAIYKETGTLTLNYSMFENCMAEGNGGVIYNEIGNLNVINGTFRNNSTNTDGGSIYNAQQGEATIIDSTFDGNTASNAGGAISTQGILSIQSSRFTNNQTSSIGAGIYGVNSKITIADSMFLNNYPGTAGGAIYTSNSTVTISNSEFDSHHNANQGGAIYNESGEYTIQASRFINNSANEGGAIYNNGEMRITGESYFQGNYANEGGAIYTTDLNRLWINAEGGTANFIGNQAAFPTSIEYFPEYIAIHNQQIIGSYTTSITPYLYNNYDINFGLFPAIYRLHYDPNTSDAVENMPPDENYAAGETVIVSNQIPSRIGYTFTG